MEFLESKFAAPPRAARRSDIRAGARRSAIAPASPQARRTYPKHLPPGPGQLSRGLRALRADDGGWHALKGQGQPQSERLCSTAGSAQVELVAGSWLAHLRG